MKKSLVAFFQRSPSWMVLVGILLVYGGLLFLLPLDSALRIGADEDFELSKATLLNKGFKLYTDIWDDQPPLHTYLVAQILKRVTPSVVGPRLLTVGFSLLLLSSFFLLIGRIYGRWVAGLGTLLLIASPAFLELSCSVMQEMPALAPAVAGLALVMVGPRHRWYLPEITAGMLFAISLQIKFIGIIYLPLATFCLWLKNRPGPSIPLPHTVPPSDRVTIPSGKMLKTTRHAHISITEGLPSRSPAQQGNCFSKWIPYISFTGGLIFCFLVIHLLIGQDFLSTQLRQSWEAHFSGAKSFEYGSPSDYPYDWLVFLRNWDLTLPALAGLVVALSRERARNLSIIPVVWLAFTLLIFSSHRPWWSYYYIHTSIPLCWLAAIGIHAMGRGLSRHSHFLLKMGLALYFLAAFPWMGARLFFQIAHTKQGEQTHNSLILKEIARYKPFTTFLYSDEPIFTFHAGIPLPPRLAVVSLKRFWSGNLSNVELTRELQQANPGLILLGNDPRPLPFSDWLDNHYRLVYQDSKHLLYALPEVSRKVTWEF